MAAQPQVGDVVADRYVLLAKIGKGGVAQVFHALDQRMQQDVALKLLTDQSTTNVQAFRREVGLTRKVHHPNVVAVHDIGVHEGWLFLTMELVEGTALHLVHASDERVDVTRVTHYLLEAARGLAMAHEHGVVHRDIKPRNLMLRDDGRLCILDFGLVRSLEGDDSGLSPVGTPYYMSPEQVEGASRLSGATDVFSLGVVIYELLAGRHPYGRDHPVASAVRRLQPCETRVAELRPGIDQDLDALVMEMLGPIEGRPTARRVAERAEQVLLRAAHTPQRFRRRVAVLPFRFDGDERYVDLASILHEYVLDLLATERALDVITYEQVADLPTEAIRPEVQALSWTDALEVTVRRGREGVHVEATLRARDGTRWRTQLHDVATGGDDAEVLAGRLARVVGERLTARTSNQALSLRAAVRRVLVTRPFDVTPLEGVTTSPWLTDTHEPALTALGALIHWRMASGPDDAEADAALRRAEALTTPHAATWLAIARRAELAGDLVQEGRALREVLEVDPLDVSAIARLGVFLMRFGRSAEGSEELRRAVRLEPAMVVAWLELHRTAAFAGEEREAAWTLDEARRQAGPTLAIAITEARAAAWRGDPAAARASADAHVQRALAGEPLPRGELGAQLRWLRIEVALAEDRDDDAIAAWWRSETQNEQGEEGVGDDVPDGHAQGTPDAPPASAVQPRLVLPPFDTTRPPDVDWLRRCPWAERIADDGRWGPILRRARDAARTTLSSMGFA